MRLRPAVLGVFGFAAFVFPGAAVADDWAESLAAAPPTFSIGDWEFRAWGFADASGYAAHQEGGLLRGTIDDSGVTGQVRATARLERMFDDGLTVGARTTIEAYHDTLSGDRYGSDTFEFAYLYARTAYGTLEIGQVDGVGSRLGVTGPKVDDHVTLDDPDTFFFRNPETGHGFDRVFYPYSASWSSANDAKISFISTRILGLQAGVSFTPEQIKTPIPFGGNAPNGANQSYMWEATLTYTTFISDNLAVDGSLAYTQGYLHNAAPGLDDLHDWAVGAEAQYTAAAVKFTLGGAYRVSNAYAFNTGAVLDSGETRLFHGSALVEWESWRAGAEYSHGDVDGAHGLSGFAMEAYQLAGGYRLNDNIQLTAGWQWWNYDRDVGVFFNGRRSLDMNAGFLTIGYTL